MHEKDDWNSICQAQVNHLPKLKLKVEYAIIGYLIDELTDEEFKERIQSILDKFNEKNLLHKNIGQLTSEWENKNRALKTKFSKIWILLGQISPKIHKHIEYGETS